MHAGWLVCSSAHREWLEVGGLNAHSDLAGAVVTSGLELDM